MCLGQWHVQTTGCLIDKHKACAAVLVCSTCKLAALFQGARTWRDLQELDRKTNVIRACKACFLPSLLFQCFRRYRPNGHHHCTLKWCLLCVCPLRRDLGLLGAKSEEDMAFWTRENWVWAPAWPLAKWFWANSVNHSLLIVLRLINTKSRNFL